MTHSVRDPVGTAFFRKINRKDSKMKPTFKRIFSLVLALVTVLSIAAVGGSAAEERAPIKNIIIMIPDGGGFGNLDLAEAVKKAGGIEGARTPLTTDTIEGETHEGLYLSDYLVALTMTRSADDEITDSAAGGTAIATGYRTNNSTISLLPTKDATPVASIMEASQMLGKTIGMVSTCYYFDATPASFTAHAETRDDYAEITRQMMDRGLEFMLGGGEAFTAPDSNGTKIPASDYGYTAVNNAEELNAAIEAGNTKLWGNFHTEEAIDDNNLDWDIDTDSDDPTILELTKAAFNIVEKVDDEDGFCIMIEGSCVDKAAHGSSAPEVAGEFLAFDEAFAYAVNWAKKDGETIVVALPDHDTGGLEVPNLETGIPAVQKRENPEDFVWHGDGDHTAQNGGIWLYAPDGYREQFLETIGVPTNGTPADVRQNKFYKDIVFNPDYEVKNCDVVGGIEAVTGIDLEAANNELVKRMPVTGMAKDGVYSILNSDETVKLEVKMPLNASYIILPDGRVYDYSFGVNLRTGMPPKVYGPARYMDMIGRATASFNDVTGADWFYKYVWEANFFGVMQGMGDGSFAPGASMTRAQIVTMLARMSNADVTGMGENLEFSDTDKDQWYADYVGWAVESGIVLGYNDNTFKPNNPVLRQELASLIARYIRAFDEGWTWGDEPLTESFTDAASFQEWAAADIEYLRANALIGGDADGNFNPTSTATRAEAATIITRFDLTEIIK